MMQKYNVILILILCECGVNSRMIPVKSLNSLVVPFESDDFYMGMELEVSYPTYQYKYNAETSFENLQKKYFSNWELQNEYSIRHSIEYTSYPISYTTMLDEVPRLTAFINMTGGEVWDHTGIHLHVSRKSIEKYKPDPDMSTYEYHKYLWWKVNNPKYRQKWISLAGRESRYASFDNSNSDSIYNGHVMCSENEYEYMMCVRCSVDKMVALNLIPTKTIEFRMFRSSTDPSRVRQYVEGVYNVIVNNSDYGEYLRRKLV